MKTLFIVSIAAIALIHSAHARDWMWFHGDIGLSSPFVSSPSTTKGTTGAARETFYAIPKNGGVVMPLT